MHMTRHNVGSVIPASWRLIYVVSFRLTVVSAAVVLRLLLLLLWVVIIESVDPVHVSRGCFLGHLAATLSERHELLMSVSLL